MAAFSVYSAANPVSGNMLNSPDHAEQHAGVNGAVQAIEKYIGQGGLAFDVSFCGAAGNGTTDDTEAVQAAINAAQAVGTGAFGSTGARVYFPPGNYLISSPLTMTWPIIMQGAGWGSIITLKAGSNCDMIDFAPTTSNWFIGAKIADLTLNAQGASQTAGYVVNGLGAVWCEFSHLQVLNPWDGIYLHNDNLGGFGHHNWIHHCFFENGYLSNGGPGRGVYLHQSDENTVENNVFQNCGTSTGPALQEDASLQIIKNNVFVIGSGTLVEALKVQSSNTISGNIFDGSTNYQVEIDGNNNTYTGNVHQMCASAYSNLLLSGGTNTVSKNVFLVNASSANVSGIYANNSGGNLVEGNVFSGSWGTAPITGMANVIARNNSGVNPYTVSAPAFPATTVTYTNATGVDVYVYIANGTAAMTTQINGSTGPSLAAIATGMVMVPAGGTFKPTYASGSPSWVFVGN